MLFVPNRDNYFVLIVMASIIGVGELVLLCHKNTTSSIIPIS
jgi:hypothetical protein